jgi:UDP-glucose 4-epimerase
MKKVLITGGLGYIGSHTVVKLVENGYYVVILDNLSNSDIIVFDKLKKIVNHNIRIYVGDVNDSDIIEKIFIENKIDSIIHFASLKSVNESIYKSLDYYYNNVSGTINLLKNMEKYDIKNIIFSSSCTVYGEPEIYPVTEETKLKEPLTPYGKTKSMCEKIIESNLKINSIILRYFNPIGNHQSGIIYENPKGISENLLPYIIGVIIKKYEFLKVFGDDYDTHDGTAIRDYIDVNDLSNAHLKSLDLVGKKRYDVFNVGTGKGYSVMDIINEFKKNGYDIPYKIYSRRDGDIEKIWADIEKSKNVLGWTPIYTISDSIKSIITSIENNVDK